jgi:phosphatidate cytidylyltransferase
VVILACWLDYHHNFGREGVWLLPLALALTALATREVLALLRAQGHRPVAGVVYAGTLIVMLSACVPWIWADYPADMPISGAGWTMLGLVAVVMLAFAGEMLIYEKPGGVIVRVALTMFTVCYIGLLMSFVGHIRLFGSNQVGMAALLSLVAVAKTSDTGAYFCGRLLGRHKLVPRLSPGKTVEGAVGGIAAACLASLVVFQFVVPLMTGSERTAPWWSWLSYGVIVALAAMLGDLAESLLKRDMDHKDSGNLVPGMGGVLDFMDSLLFAAPVAYACWVFELVRV